MRNTLFLSWTRELVTCKKLSMVTINAARNNHPVDTLLLAHLQAQAPCLARHLVFPRRRVVTNGSPTKAVITRWKKTKFTSMKSGCRKNVKRDAERTSWKRNFSITRNSDVDRKCQLVTIQGTIHLVSLVHPQRGLIILKEIEATQKAHLLTMAIVSPTLIKGVVQQKSYILTARSTVTMSVMPQKTRGHTFVNNNMP